MDYSKDRLSGLKERLRKAFFSVAASAVIIGGGLPGFDIPEAEAFSTTSIMIAGSIASSNARNRHNRTAMNNVIVNPSEKNISKMLSRGLIAKKQVPYVVATVKDMNIPKSTNASDITSKQLSQFKKILKEKQQIDIISSITSGAALEKGLSASLAPYFNECKAENGSYGQASYSDVKAIKKCMKDEHWVKDTKPMLKNMGFVAGGLLLVGAGFAASRRRKNHKPQRRSF